MDGDLSWPGAKPPVHFGAACFDAAALRLTVDGREVALEQRPMALLSLLLARRGQVVSKEQILDALWPGRTVTDASLTKCVARLRMALGDADHTIIHTVHGTGYRFDAAVTEPAPQVTLTQAVETSLPLAPARGSWRLAAGLGAFFAVCVSLSVVLDVTRSRPAPAPLPPSPQARALYMSGLQDWAQRTPAALTRAVEEFTGALRLDPDYAEAYVGLATCYDLLPEYAAMATAQAYPLARAAALRALAINPDLPAAHAAYAFALFWGDWNFSAGMHEYRRALQLAPDNAAVQHWYATSLDNTGAHAEALAHIERALELDPGSPSIRADRGLLLFNSGRVAEARAVLTALEAGAPDFLPPHAYLADIAFATGDDATYLREKGIHLLLQHDAAGLTILQAAQQGFAAGGHAGMQRAILAARLAGYAAGNVPAADVARAFAGIGDRKDALAYLSLAIDRHDSSAVSVLNDPEWRGYLSDAGVSVLLARLGLQGGHT
jgi:DNA-binding winged helix-turn-helix (wHTH) protein/tetratricopeptide (TPR) repeat protein